MPQRPSNREIKALTHLGEENAFAGMLKKGWVVEAEGLPGKYRATIKGLTVHEGEIIFAGRYRK